MSRCVVSSLPFHAFLVASALASAACSSSPTAASGTDAGRPDALRSEGGAHDAATSHRDAHATHDAAHDASARVDAGARDGGATAPVLCPTAPCSSGQVCCGMGSTSPDAGYGSVQCMAECPDGGATIACQGPSNCGAETPECCADVTLVTGPVTCRFGGGSSSCVAACPEHISLAPICPAADTVVLCKSDSDCTGNYPTCCQFPGVPAGMSFCSPLCVKTCMTDSDCPATAVASGSTPEPTNVSRCVTLAGTNALECSIACNPVAAAGPSGCPSGEGNCYLGVTAANEQFTQCVVGGQQGAEGAVCSLPWDCAAGLACVQSGDAGTPHCRAMCRSGVDADCAGGDVCLSAIASNPMFGFCCSSTTGC